MNKANDLGTAVEKELLAHFEQSNLILKQRNVLFDFINRSNIKRENKPLFRLHPGGQKETAKTD